MKELKEDGTFEGYLAVFGNVDLQGDRIEKGAFGDSLKSKKQFPLLWQHDPGSPIGVFKAIEDDYGLKIDSSLNLETIRGKEAYALLKQGALSGLSIGFETVKYRWDEGEIRVLEKVKLWEGSLVTFPANPKATVTSVKSIEDQVKDLKEKIDRLAVIIGEKGAETLKGTLDPILLRQAEVEAWKEEKARRDLDREIEALKNIVGGGE